MAEKNKVMKKLAAQIRIETIRQMMEIGFGHIGGSMSIADLIAVLYGGVMKINPLNPKWKNRDYFVCSKGHAGPAVYSALALKGFFPMAWIKTLNKPGTRLPSHVDHNKTPGIDMTAGSLGQGLSAAMGIALANRAEGRSNYTYVVAGDGECQEGQIWEAVMSAAHYKLDHLILFVDFNNRQIDGTLEIVNDITNFSERFAAFRWNTQEVDGHNVEEIDAAITKAKAATGKPSAIIMKTLKGKGCSFVEELWYNHHIPMPRPESENEIKKLEEYISSL